MFKQIIMIRMANTDKIFTIETGITRKGLIKIIFKKDPDPITDIAHFVMEIIMMPHIVGV